MMVQNEHYEVNECPAVPLLLDSEESRIWETESSALKKGFVRKVVFVSSICKESSILSASSLQEN